MHGLNGRPQDEGIVGDPGARIPDDVRNAPCDCTSVLGLRQIFRQIREKW